MQIQFTINGSEWTLTTGNKSLSGVMESALSPRPRFYAIHKLSRRVESVSPDGKIENPEHRADHRKPTYLKDSSGWITAQENQLEVAAREVLVFAREALERTREAHVRQIRLEYGL